MPERDEKKTSFTSRYVISVIVIRILGRVLWSNARSLQNYLVPLLGAAAVSYVWPHILERRSYEKRTQEQNEAEAE